MYTCNSDSRVFVHMPVCVVMNKYVQKCVFKVQIRVFLLSASPNRLTQSSCRQATCLAFGLSLLCLLKGSLAGLTGLNRHSQGSKAFLSILIFVKVLSLSPTPFWPFKEVNVDRGQRA